MADLTRILKPNPFADDDGSITAELAAAYAQPEHARVEAIVAALGRVIVPVLPHAHPGMTGGGLAPHEPAPTDPLECRDEDLVRVDFPGGRRALAIFSSAGALREWNDRARPVPVEVSKVAATALQRADGVLVLDPGKKQTWLGRSATAALATSTPWVAPWDDPLIVRRITLGIDGYLPGLEKIGIQPGANGAAVVVLYLIPPVDRDKVVTIANRVAAAMASDEYVKSRLDVVEIRPFYAGA